MAKNAKGYRFTFERKGLWLWEAFQHVYYQGRREGIVQSARGPHAEFEAERKTWGWREIGKGQVVQDHIGPITMVSIVYVTPLDGKQGEAFRNVYIEQRLDSRESTCKKGYKEEVMTVFQSWGEQNQSCGHRAWGKGMCWFPIGTIMNYCILSGSKTIQTCYLTVVVLRSFKWVLGS